MLERNLHLSIMIMILEIASADIDMTGAVPMLVCVKLTQQPPEQIIMTWRRTYDNQFVGQYTLVALFLFASKTSKKNAMSKVQQLYNKNITEVRWQLTKTKNKIA